MATLLNQEDEDQQQSEGQEQSQQVAAPSQPTAAQPIGGGGESAMVAAGAPSAAAPTTSSSAPSASKTGSGRFLNIRKYIQANQGADYAGRIGQNVQQQQQQSAQQIGQAQQAVQQQVNPEIQRLQGAGQVISQAVANPTQFAATPENLQAFSQLRSGQYQRDVAIPQEEQLRQQQAKLDEQAKLAGTESGRFQMLRETFGQPAYTRGQTSLDQLLLQGQSGQLRQLGQQTSQAAQTGQQQLGALQQQAQTYQQQLRELGAGAQQQAQEQIGGAVSGQQQAIEQRLAQIQAERQAAQQTARQRLAAGQMSAEDLARFGLSQGTTLYNVDPNQFFQAGQEANRFNVSTPEEFARMQALSQLADQENVFLPEAQATQAGQLAEAYGFNVPQFQSAIAGAQGAFQQESQAAAAPYDEAISVLQNRLASGVGTDSQRARWEAEIQNRQGARDSVVSQIASNYGVGRTLGVAQ